MDIDTQGINVGDFEDLLCTRCGNAPLTYYCPVCDFKVCLDCLPASFRRHASGALECRRCGNVDKLLATYIGYGKV